VLNKKEELARRYPGCNLHVGLNPRRGGLIDIQLHDAPVEQFVEASANGKWDYAMEIHKHIMDLVHHVEEIFQDYTPESN
jgi:hypothetical protein